MKSFVKALRSTRGARKKPLGSLFSVFAFCLIASQAWAAPVDVNIGVLSFDVLIPSTPQFTGVDQFTINNFTGSNNLAPDFPIVDSVLFQNVTVKVGSTTINLPDIAPGSVQPLSLGFVDSDLFASAIFSATVNGTTFNLADGTVLQLTSDVVTGTIVPSSGRTLAAGLDLVVLTVNGNIGVSSVPEPSSRSLSVAATILMLGIVGFRVKFQTTKS
jgi:hypothetical protein